MKIQFQLKLGVMALLIMALLVPMKAFCAFDAEDEGLIKGDAYVIDQALKTLDEDIAEAYSDEFVNGNAYKYHEALRASEIDPEDLTELREAAFGDAQDFYTRAQDIKRLASSFNKKYYSDVPAASPYSDSKLKEALYRSGYNEEAAMLGLGFAGEGYVALDWTLSKFSSRSTKVSSGAGAHRGHSSGKYTKRDPDEEDEDSDSHSGKSKKRSKKSDDEDCDTRSGVETFFDNLMPWVGVIGGGVAAYGNYKLKNDMLKTGERLMSTAVAQGNSPYLYMPMMQSAMNYDPFGSVFESTLTPSLMAMTELANRGRGGKASGNEFAKYYANKFRYQRMMDMMAQARAQGNTTSSANSNFNYTFQRAIEGLKGLDRAFVPMDQMLDQMERRLGGVMQEMNGGMSSRQRQDLLNVVSNLSNNIKSQEMFNQNMSMIFDQMRMLVGQAKQSARNQDGLINGQGGLTTTISGSTSDAFNSQWQRVGNPGVPYMNGGPVYGGGSAGAQVQYRGPGGEVFVGVGR